MSLELPFGILPVNPVPVEATYGPWADVATAKANIPLGIRYIGLTAAVQDGGETKEYWFKDGINDVDFILKTTVGGGGTGLPNYIIPTGDTVTVDLNKQHFTFGDLLLDGTLVNYGKVVVTEGILDINDGLLDNEGIIELDNDDDETEDALPSPLVHTIVAGTNISVDDTDPENPIINVTGIAGAELISATTFYVVESSDKLKFVDKTYVYTDLSIAYADAVLLATQAKPVDIEIYSSSNTAIQLNITASINRYVNLIGKSYFTERVSTNAIQDVGANYWLWTEKIFDLGNKANIMINILNPATHAGGEVFFNFYNLYCQLINMASSELVPLNYLNIHGKDYDLYFADSITYSNPSISGSTTTFVSGADKVYFQFTNSAVNLLPKFVFNDINNLETYIEGPVRIFYKNIKTCLSNSGPSIAGRNYSHYIRAFNVNFYDLNVYDLRASQDYTNDSSLIIENCTFVKDLSIQTYGRSVWNVRFKDCNFTTSDDLNNEFYINIRSRKTSFTTYPSLVIDNCHISKARLYIGGSDVNTKRTADVEIKNSSFYELYSVNSLATFIVNPISAPNTFKIKNCNIEILRHEFCGYADLYIENSKIDSFLWGHRQSTTSGGNRVRMFISGLQMQDSISYIHYNKPPQTDITISYSDIKGGIIYAPTHTGNPTDLNLYVNNCSIDILSYITGPSAIVSNVLMNIINSSIRSITAQNSVADFSNAMSVTLFLKNVIMADYNNSGYPVILDVNNRGVGASSIVVAVSSTFQVIQHSGKGLVLELVDCNVLDAIDEQYFLSGTNNIFNISNSYIESQSALLTDTTQLPIMNLKNSIVGFMKMDDSSVAEGLVLRSGAIINKYNPSSSLGPLANDQTYFSNAIITTF